MTKAKENIGEQEKEQSRVKKQRNKKGYFQTGEISADFTHVCLTKPHN